MSMRNRNPLSDDLLSVVAQMCTAENQDAADELDDQFFDAVDDTPTGVYEYLDALASHIRTALADVATTNHVQPLGSGLFILNDVTHNGTIVTVAEGRITRLVLGGTGSGSVDIQDGDPTWNLTAHLRTALEARLTTSAPAF